MSENHGKNHNDKPRENQVKRRGAQTGFEQFPLLPEKIADQDVTGGIGRRPRDVVKEKSAPLHFRYPGQKIHHDGRKHEDEPRYKSRPASPKAQMPPRKHASVPATMGSHSESSVFPRINPAPKRIVSPGRGNPML